MGNNDDRLQEKEKMKCWDSHPHRSAGRAGRAVGEPSGGAEDIALLRTEDTCPATARGYVLAVHADGTTLFKMPYD